MILEKRGSPFYNKKRGSKSTPQPMWDVDLHILQKNMSKAQGTKILPREEAIAGEIMKSHKTRIDYIVNIVG